MMFSPQSQFAWDTLKTFFEDPSRRMKDVHVKRITVIEPLQGEPLTIPLRFIKSFEVSSSTTAVLGPPGLTFIRQDLHTILYLAFKGTRGGHYIEGRRYELDMPPQVKQSKRIGWVLRWRMGRCSRSQS
jgi:hypothetical protein